MSTMKMVELTAEETAQYRALGRTPAQRRETVNRRITAAEHRYQEATKQLRGLSGRINDLERDGRHQRFAELAGGRRGSSDGQPWLGDPETHIRILETLADANGEDSPEVKRYIEQQNGIAAVAKSSDAIAGVQVKALVDQLRETSPELTPEQAEAQVYAEHPELYHGDTGANQSDEPSAAEREATQLAEAKRKANPKLTPEQAKAEVYAEHPELYE